MTVVKRVSFNILFRAFVPYRFGLVFGLFVSNSLAHAFVEKGMLGGDLSTSTTVDSKEFQHKSVRVCRIRL